MIRLFTAFPIPDLLAKDFLDIAGRNRNYEGVRWTTRHNLHVTLFFIGEVHNEHIGTIAGIVRNVFSAIQEFSLRFEQIEVRRKKSRPVMIWARFEKSDDFSKLSRRIEESVKEFMTIETQHKDPVPHCTLARLKPSALVDTMDLSFNNNFSLEVDHVELWKTIQTKSGVIYEKID